MNYRLLLIVCSIVLIAAAALLCARNAHAGEAYLELGLGMNYSVDIGPKSIPQSVIRFRYELDKGEWWKPNVIEFNHHSSVTEGLPFNDRPEDLTDQVSIIYRFKVW